MTLINTCVLEKMPIVRLKSRLTGEVRRIDVSAFDTFTLQHLYDAVPPLRHRYHTYLSMIGSDGVWECRVRVEPAVGTTTIRCHSRQDTCPLRSQAWRHALCHARCCQYTYYYYYRNYPYSYYRNHDWSGLEESVKVGASSRFGALQVRWSDAASTCWSSVSTRTQWHV